MGGGKHETDADFRHAGRHLRGLEVERNARGFQYVGAAGTRGDRAVAVFGHAPAGGGDHEAGGGGYIEQIGAIATGADDVHHVFAVDRHRARQTAHHHHGAGDLVQRLPLHAQTHQEGPDLRVSGLAGHDLAHDALHVLEGEVLAVGDSGQGCLDVHHPSSGQ